MSWNGELAKIWTKMVGPSRPTISELAIYTKWVRRLQLSLNRKIKLLILGSTPEFRDWGYENNFDITVVDCNIDYYESITREIRHKDIKEKLICKKWQELDFEDEYDVIIGDLVIGNILPHELDGFIYKMSKALTKNGMFLGKSFFHNKDYIPLAPEILVKKYYDDIPWHPYSYFVYDLSIYCKDENNLLYFPKQYKVLDELNKKGLLKDETFEFFKNVGWDNEMKFLFHIPDLEFYENLLEKYMKIYTIEYGSEIYSSKFPLHIVIRKDNDLFVEKEKK